MPKVSKFKVKRDIIGWFIENLWRSFTLIDSKDEMQGYLRALLSKPEIIMLAKRVQIAKMLVEGYDYRSIRNVIKVTDPTIAKISNGLEDHPEVFRLVEKLHIEEKALEKKYDKSNLKSRYPAYYALENLLDSLDKPIRRHNRHSSLYNIDKQSK